MWRVSVSNVFYECYEKLDFVMCTLRQYCNFSAICSFIFLPQGMTEIFASLKFDLSIYLQVEHIFFYFFYLTYHFNFNTNSMSIDIIYKRTILCALNNSRIELL